MALDDKAEMRLAAYQKEIVRQGGVAKLGVPPPEPRRRVAAGRKERAAQCRARGAQHAHENRLDGDQGLSQRGRKDRPLPGPR